MAESIFEDDELQADALAPDAEAPPVEEQPEPGPERDENGRFKAKEPEGEEAPEERRADGTVPQGALHAEREKRKQSDAERDAVKEELKQAREQLEAFAEMRRQIAERKPQPMPEADDPAAMEHLRARLAQNEEQINRFGQERDQQTVQQREMAEIGAVVSRSEQAFREQQPNYDPAINHLVQARAAELQLYGLAPAQIQMTIAEEAADIVRSAVAQGRDPAEMSYQIALSRGYRPEQQQDAPQGGAQAKLAAIARAQGASRSLGSGGGSGSHQLNADAVAALSQDEFDAIYSTPEGRAMIDAL